MGFMMFLVMNPSLECIYRRKKSLRYKMIMISN
jgi:hypothetical protein